MSDHEAGSIFDDLRDGGLDLPLGLGINRRSGFVHDEQSRLPDHGSSERDELLLAEAEPIPTFAHLGFITIGKCDNEIMSADKPRCRLDFLIRRTEISIANVLAD